ncbi:hypothetical protein OESDEN_25271 [Oesophagostomum dentatum]|uniref:Uncharacterized protein n=1 Tax=Oesophagostomum dentatum TaxID=61180 RepID=A0A0B1RPX8_OESDE|nr:hypothetical protein OESDEN_25271 [Oesophagostomum dentatum]
MRMKGSFLETEKHSTFIFEKVLSTNDKINASKCWLPFKSHLCIIFLGIIDRVYGSRLLSMKRCGENLPKLVVDCRFLTEFSVAVQSSFARQVQTLHDSNWTSRVPFEIAVANFRPDNQVAEIVKRYIIFGPRQKCLLIAKFP